MRLFLVYLFFTFSIVQGQENDKNNKNYFKIDSVPQLTHQQMIKEYDMLLSYIKGISPAIYFNKEVRGIDFDKHTKKLKSIITPKTSFPEYLSIIKKTINAAQDNHTSILNEGYIKNYIQKFWIPSGIKVIGYDSTAVNYAKHYDAYFTDTFTTKVNLELVYSSGEYYNLLPFNFKNINYPGGMKLIKCNERNVHQVVKNMVELVSALKWDRSLNRTYFEDFYRSPFLYKKDKLNLVFEDKNKVKHTLNISKDDKITFLETKKNKFSYNENSKVTSHFFEKEKIFYTKLPKMEENLGDTISNHLKSIINKNTVQAIVLDIRGNGGGSDLTYAKFLQKIIKKPLETDIMVGRIYSPINCEYNEITADTISKYPHLALHLDKAPTLNSTKMFYIKMPKYQYATPDSIQYPFNGKIYILQDRFIYSSSSNLSNLAYNNEQLISIGENPNLLGGLQTNPIAICLPYSKLFIRIEPQIDFTNIKTKADIFQNNVEYVINYPVEFIHEKTTTNKDPLDKDFLYTKDPMFKKVLELEKN